MIKIVHSDFWVTSGGVQQGCRRPRGRSLLKKGRVARCMLQVLPYGILNRVCRSGTSVRYVRDGFRGVVFLAFGSECWWE